MIVCLLKTIKEIASLIFETLPYITNISLSKAVYPDPLSNQNYYQTNQLKTVY